MDEKYENQSEETKGTNVDQNQGKAVVTGFHRETSESEVTQLLKELIIEVGMDIGSARIECPAKPITYAFIHFKNDEERNKFIRSANMLKKELRGNIKITRSIKGQIVLKTVESGNLKYIKYQNVEAEVEEQVQKWQSKTRRNDCEL